MMALYPKVIDMKCDHELKYIKCEQEGSSYRYKCAKCGEELLLGHADESIRNQPTPPGIEEMEVSTAAKSYASVDTDKKKKQSDYHKRRYQLMKHGQWTGSLKHGEEKST
jgi:hypothetical protein